MGRGARRLALKRELLVATAELQRAELGLAWREAPWRTPLALLRTGWRIWRALRGCGATGGRFSN